MKTKPVACLREACAVGREAAGEASVAVPAGGAIERRKPVGSECRVCHLMRRQHQSHRKNGEGRLAPRCRRTHARWYAFCRDLRGLHCAPEVVRSRAGKGKTEASDARDEEVGCSHSVCWAAPRSGGFKSHWRSGKERYIRKWG